MKNRDPKPKIIIVEEISPASNSLKRLRDNPYYLKTGILMKKYVDEFEDLRRN